MYTWYITLYTFWHKYFQCKIRYPFVFSHVHINVLYSISACPLPMLNWDHSENLVWIYYQLKVNLIIPLEVFMQDIYNIITQITDSINCIFPVWWLGHRAICADREGWQVVWARIHWWQGKVGRSNKCNIYTFCVFIKLWVNVEQLNSEKN